MGGPGPDPDVVSSTLLACLAATRAAHWAARSYAAHEALDRLYRVLDTAGDALVEAGSWQTRQTQSAKPRGLSLEVPAAAVTGDASATVEWVSDRLRRVRERLHAAPSTSARPELQQLLDDMLVACARAAYLLRMRDR